MKKLKIIFTITIFSLFLVSCSIFFNDEKIDEVKNDSISIDSNLGKSEEIEENKKSQNSLIETVKETIGEKIDESLDSFTDELKIIVGEYITIPINFDVYSNAQDAKNKEKSILTYDSGNYFVYKITKDAINLSKSQGQPGGWVNFESINIDVKKISDEQFYSQNTTNTSTVDSKHDLDVNIDNNLSNESKSWSYAYPDDINYLNLYRAYYRLDTPYIYLTFDNGYEYENNTSEILDILARNDVKATFFTTGPFLRDNPNISNRIYKEGHNLSNHTENHLAQGRNNLKDIKDDILAWEDTFFEVIGLSPDTHLMRPPEGSYSEQSLSLANSLGYKTIFWNYAYVDWDTSNQPNPDESLQNLLKHNEPGSIILLHAVSDTNVEILERYIQETKKQGYTFGILK